LQPLCAARDGRGVPALPPFTLTRDVESDSISTEILKARLTELDHIEQSNIERFEKLQAQRRLEDLEIQKQRADMDARRKEQAQENAAFDSADEEILREEMVKNRQILRFDSEG
jgi:hypothetical protein